MLANRILLGSAAFGLSFGLSFLAEQNLRRSLMIGLIAPAAYASTVAVEDRQRRSVRLKAQTDVGQLQEFEQQRLALSQSLVSAAAEKQQAETSLSYLQTQIEQIQTQIHAQQQQEQTLTQAIATLEGRKQQLEVSFQQLQARVTDLATQEREIQQAIASSTQERQTLAVEVAQLTQEFGQLQAQLTGVTEQKLQLSNEVAALQTTRQLLESQAADLQTQIQTLERSRQALNESLSAISTNDLQPIKSEIQALSSTFTNQKFELEAVLEGLLIEVRNRLAEATETGTIESRGSVLLPQPELPTVEELEPAEEEIGPQDLVLVPQPELQIIEEREASEETFLTPNWHALINQLSDSEYWALEAILRRDAEALKQIADAALTMPQMLIEAINEKANEIVHDLIFETGTSSFIPPLYDEEYEERLRLAIAVVGRENSPVTTIDVSATKSPVSVVELLPTTAKTWNCIMTIDGAANTLAISPDGETLVGGHSNGEITLWNLNTGKLLLINSHPDYTGSIYSIAIHPKGKLLFCSGSSQDIQVWHLKTGEMQRPLSGHSTAVNSIAISPDGQTLASGSADRSIRLWNIKSGRLLFTLQGAFSFVTSVAFSSRTDKNILASGSQDGTIRLWNLETKSALDTLAGHAGKICSMAFSPDGKTLVSAGAEGTIKLWETQSGVSSSFAVPKAGASSVAISPDGNLLVSGGEDCTIRLWNLKSRELLETLTEHTGKICAIAFGPESDTFVSSSADQTIKVWRYS